MRHALYLVIAIVLFLTAAGNGCTTIEEQEAGHFEKAKLFIAQKKYNEAVLELKNVIQLNPENDAARLTLGKTYMEMGEFLLSVQTYDAAVRQDPENLEAHLILGQVLLTAKNTLNARKAAKTVLEKQPDNIDALLLLAGVQEQEKNPSGAIETLKSAIAFHPKMVRARLFLAHLYESTGERASAAQTYLEAISVVPTAPAPYIKLMRLYGNDGQSDKVDGVLNQLIAESDGYDSELLELARSFESPETDDIAERIYRYAVSAAPAEATLPLISLGNFYVRKGDKEKAMASFQQALKINSKDVDVLANIAHLDMGMGNMDAAEATVRKALAIDPDHVLANYTKGVIAFSGKDFVEAGDRFDHVIKNSPEGPMAYYYKALCFLESDVMSGSDSDLFRAAAGYTDDADAWVKKQAEEYLLKAVDLSPGLLLARLALAELYLGDRNLSDARLQIDEIFNRAPDNRHALLLQGALKILQKDFSGAEAVCKKALEKDPQDSRWLTRLGVVYALMERPEDALSVCRKALDLNPRQFGTLQLMLDLYLGSRDFKAASSLCETYREKLKGDPTAEAIIDNMTGKVYLAQGFQELAAQSFQKAVAVAPTFLSPRMTIARLLLVAGRHDEAISELEEILKINKNYLPACMALGDIYYAKGNKKQAEKYYRTVLKIEAGYGPAANNLAYILSKYDNKVAEALSLAQTAVNKQPNDANARDTLGWIHYRIGNIYKASVEIEKSLEINPNSAYANYHMGLICYKNKEFNKARAYFLKTLEINPDFEEAEETRAMLDM